MKSVALALAAILCAFATPASAQPAVDPDTSYPFDADGRPVHKLLGIGARGGLAYRSLYGIPLRGGDVHAGLGVERRSFAMYVEAGGLFAATPGGLRASHVDLGATFLLPIDRLRLGVRPALGWFRLARVTEDSHFDAATFGAAALATVDVVRSRGSAVYLGIEGRADLVSSLQGEDDAPWVPGVAAYAGFRWLPL